MCVLKFLVVEKKYIFYSTNWIILQKLSTIWKHIKNQTDCFFNETPCITAMVNKFVAVAPPA